MAFKPDRRLLNVNFEGYKLSESLLSHVSAELKEEVQVAKLKDEDYSYQHMRAYSLHNHLAVNPYDDSSVYWYTTDGKIQQGTYNDGEISVKTCYTLPLPSIPTGQGGSVTITNPSFAFINGTHCLFCNGGSQIHIFSITPPSNATTTSTEVQDWELEMTVPNSGDTINSDSPLMIIVATIPESKLYVDVLCAELCDPSAIQHIRSSTSTDSSVANFKWLRFTFKEPPSQENADSAVSLSFKDATVSTVTSFECRAFPLYAAIIEKNIFFISEAKPPLKEDADIDMEETEGEGDGNIPTGKQGEEEHHGLGYDNLGYQWSQTDSDVTVTLTLPENVKKTDVECEIEANEVVLGLTDGTTYLRGKLHAPIDPEASTWTLEKNVLEVSLEKKEAGLEWPYLHTDSQPKKHVYLSEREDGLIQEEIDKAETLLEEMKKKSATSGDKSPSETPPPAKKPRPSIQSPLEECDASVEDTSLYMISDRGTIFGKLGLGGRQIVFTSPGAKDLHPYVSIRHDVDAVVWQPIGGTAWTHVTTFNALGYIQASKEDRKFTIAPPSLKFVAVSDCKRHVFVYMQPAEGIMGNSSAEGVHTMVDRADILGLRASDKGLVFVLTAKSLTVLQVALS